jgi:hypothetical protein
MLDLARQVLYYLSHSTSPHLPCPKFLTGEFERHPEANVIKMKTKMRMEVRAGNKFFF